MNIYGPDSDGFEDDEFDREPDEPFDWNDEYE